MAYTPNNPNGQTTAANSAPVVLASDQTLPLPSGAATAANQASANTKLDTIHADLIAALPAGSNTIGNVNVNGTVPVSGTVTANTGLAQPLTDTQLRATAVPVSAASLPLPSGAATASNQSTEITALNQIHADLIAALPAGGNTIGSVNVLGGNVTAVKTDGSAVTQPVSASALPLPTGAATSANQTTLGSSTTKINDGTNTAAVKAANIVPIAGDPALVVAISPNSTVAVTSASTLNTQNPDASTAISISANGTSSGQITSMAGDATGLIAITGTFVATVQVQLTADGSTWNNVTGNQLVFNISTGQWVPGGNITAAGFYFINIAGLSGIRVITTAYTSGTVTGFVRASAAAYMTQLSNASLPATLGQQAASTSLPVTLSNENVQDLYVTGQSAQTATVNNILTAASGATATDVQQYRSFSVQVVSTGTAGTFIFEGSNDNTNFQAVPVFNQALVVTVPIVTAITASASQIIYNGACNFRYLRLRIATTITGGSIQAFSTFTQTPFAATSLPVSQGTAANLNATATISSGTVTTVSTVTTLSQFAASAAAADATANPTSTITRDALHLFNGTSWDRQYNNTEVTLLASAARTTTQTSADIVNYNWSKLTVVLDMTVVGTGSVTVSIDGKDTASGKYINLLTGAAITTNSTNRYRIGEALAAVANAVAQDYIPRIIRIVVTANNANSATYSVGYNFGL